MHPVTSRSRGRQQFICRNWNSHLLVQVHTIAERCDEIAKVTVRTNSFHKHRRTWRTQMCRHRLRGSQLWKQTCHVRGSQKPRRDDWCSKVYHVAQSSCGTTCKIAVLRAVVNTSRSRERERLAARAFERRLPTPADPTMSDELSSSQDARRHGYARMLASRAWPHCKFE